MWRTRIRPLGSGVAEAAFVTGGSGFIGGRLIGRLVGEGRTVRALARSDASAARSRALGAEPVRGDLGDRASLAAGAEARVAFHLAAHLGEWGPWEEFERGNVEGTERAGGLRRGRVCGASSTAAPRRR